MNEPSSTSAVSWRVTAAPASLDADTTVSAPPALATITYTETMSPMPPGEVAAAVTRRRGGPASGSGSTRSTPMTTANARRATGTTSRPFARRRPTATRVALGEVGRGHGYRVAREVARVPDVAQPASRSVPAAAVGVVGCEQAQRRRAVGPARRGRPAGVGQRPGQQPHQRHAQQLGEVGGLVDERHVALDHVDHRGDEQRTREHEGDREDRPGPGRAHDHQEQGRGVGDAEGADVARLVHRRAFLTEEGGHRHHDDDRRRRGRAGPAPPTTAGPVGHGVELGDVAGEVGHLVGRGDDGGPSQAGDLVAVATARRTGLEVGGEQARVDARVLSVGLRGDGGDPLATRHAFEVAAHRHRVPVDGTNGARIRR